MNSLIPSCRLFVIVTIPCTMTKSKLFFWNILQFQPFSVNNYYCFDYGEASHSNLYTLFVMLQYNIPFNIFRGFRSIWTIPFFVDMAFLLNPPAFGFFLLTKSVKIFLEQMKRSIKIVSKCLFNRKTFLLFKSPYLSWFLLLYYSVQIDKFCIF